MKCADIHQQIYDDMKEMNQKDYREQLSNIDRILKESKDEIEAYHRINMCLACYEFYSKLIKVVCLNEN